MRGNKTTNAALGVVWIFKNHNFALAFNYTTVLTFIWVILMILLKSAVLTFSMVFK